MTYRIHLGVFRNILLNQTQFYVQRFPNLILDILSLLRDALLYTHMQYESIKDLDNVLSQVMD